MSTVKTQMSDASVMDFLNSVEDEQKRADSFLLLELFSKITGEQAKMWGSSIVGFGLYHYQSERSRQEGDWPLTAFSPRKQSLTLYVTSLSELSELLQKLGKHKTSGGCLYIKRLSDVNMHVLEQVIAKSYQAMKQLHAPK